MMKTVYKLFRRRKDGTLGPLFINRRQVIEIGQWHEAGDYPTPGYAHRPGWHAALKPHAPHLKMKPKNDNERVWVECDVLDYEEYDRPESQGGTWILAKYIRPVRILPYAPNLGAT